MFKPNYAADILYPTIRNQGRRSLIWSFVTRRSRYLHTLPEVEATCSINARHDVGVQTVTINQIRGSGGRSKDFDRNFNLLRSHNKGRWLRVAEAQQQGTTLPLVDLIQVGDIYFVSDGHHRISVARAFGQREMEARVTVWQVDGPLPWEKSTAPTITMLNAKVMQVWSAGHKLQARLALIFSGLLIGVGMKLKARYQFLTTSSPASHAARDWH